MNETIIAKSLFLIELYKAISEGRILQNFHPSSQQWIDYDGTGAGPNLLSISNYWRIKPREPERKWTTVINYIPLETKDSSQAAIWYDEGHKVTEWQEIIKEKNV